MEPSKDAYGQQIWAHLNSKPASEIVERDDNFIGISGGANAYFADFKHWPKIEKVAIGLARGKVLDIGAGAGRVALYLQERGHDVTAIDNSPLAIKTCKKRGVKNAKVLPIEDIASFRSGSFDTVVMFGNNFGLFGSFKKAKRLLKTLHRITSDDALILTASNDVYKTDDPIHLAYHKRNEERGRMPGQLRIRIRFGTCVGDWFDYLLVSKEQMQDILTGTGWQVRKFIDSDNSTYIAVLEKSQS